MADKLNVLIDDEHHIVFGFDSYQQFKALRYMDSYNKLDYYDKANIKTLFNKGTLDHRFDLNSRGVRDGGTCWHALTLYPDEYVFLASYGDAIEATAPDRDAEVAVMKLTKRICDDASDIAFSIPAVMVGYARHAAQRLVEETIKSDKHLSIFKESIPNFNDDKFDEYGNRKALRIDLIHMDEFAAAEHMKELQA